VQLFAARVCCEWRDVLLAGILKRGGGGALFAEKKGQLTKSTCLKHLSEKWKVVTTGSRT